MVNLFIKRIFIFLLPVIAFSVVIEVFLRHIPNDYTYKNEYLNSYSDKIELLILGSSHAYYDINPDYITSLNSFNAGYVSQFIDIDYKILDKYRDNWSNLKYIIVPIDYFTLFINLSDAEESWRKKDYNIYYGFKLSNKLSDNTELFSVDLRSNIKRLFEYYIKHDSFITCTELGYGIGYREPADLMVSGKEAAMRHTVNDYSVLKKNLKIINCILDFASEKNVKVIFLTLPAYKSYISELDETQLDLTMSTMKKITEENAICFYFNFLQDIRFTPDDYRDADHLNFNGARKFSLILDEILKELN